MIVPRRILLPCSIVIALLPTEVSAQACRGRPGFSTGRVVVNAGAMVASDVRSVSGGATIGMVNGPLVSGAIGYVVREVSADFRTEQTGTSLGASAAYAMIADEEGRVEFCPVAGISQVKVSGDFIGTTATLTQTARRIGGSAGYTFAASSDVVVVPFVSVEYVWFGGSIKGDSVHVQVPQDTYTPVSFGIGAVLYERFGINAAMIIPMGLPTARNSFATTLSMALGGR
jgi:hypothetical protein